MKPLDVFEVPLRGTSLVEAAAGTGKTYNIASLYIRLIVDQGYRPNQILVITFTNPAAAELTYRIRDRIKESIKVLQGEAHSEDAFLVRLYNELEGNRSKALGLLKSALYQFDEAAISTIHGFCQRLLQEYSIQLGTPPDFSLLTDPSELLQSVVDDYWRKVFERTDDPVLESYQRWVSSQYKNPDTLRKELKEVLEKEYARLIPEMPSFEDLKTKLEELRHLKKQAYDQFMALFNDIKGVFANNEINGNVYRKKRRNEYLEEVREWLGKGTALFDYPDKLENFGSKFPENLKIEKKKLHFDPLRIVDVYLSRATELDRMLKVYVLADASEKVKAEFEEAKEDSDSLSYDDLLKKVARGLKKNELLAQKIQKQFPVALIDEFQDTDPIQYEILNTVYGKSEDKALFMIGDPKQAIYSFRGADIYTYLASRKDITKGQEYSLNQNWRSSKLFIESVNRLFSHKPNPFLIEDLSFEPALFPPNRPDDEHLMMKEDQPVVPLQFIEIQKDGSTKTEISRAVYDSIGKEIQVLLQGKYKLTENDGNSSRSLNPGDIAILVNNNHQAIEMQEALLEYDLRSVLRNKSSVFNSRESDELYIILSAILNTGSDAQIRAALATDTLGYRFSTLQQLQQDEEGWAQLISQFKEIRLAWEKKGFAQAVTLLTSFFSPVQQLAAFKTAERRITNFYHLIELLMIKAREKDLNPYGLMAYFRNKKNKNGDSSDEEVIRLQSDDKLVQIITMHSSKGLEYPIVFCPFLHEKVKVELKTPFSFHKNGNTFIDLGSREEELRLHQLQSAREALAERVRVAYVALTRAKSACFVHFVRSSDIEESPLASLLCGADVVYQKLTSKLTDGAEAPTVDLEDELDRLSDQKHILVRDQNATDTDPGFPAAPHSSSKHLQVASFRRDDLNSYKQLMSFSSLTAGTTHSISEKEGFDFDEFDEGLEEPDQQAFDAFSFPRGARAGTILHTIFELIDFQDSSGLENVVREQLQMGGISNEWLPFVCEWVRDILNSPLLETKLRLRDLAPEDVLKEMEFHFPVEEINLEQVLKIIRPGSDGTHSPLPNMKGFMKGFIDLIFRVEGRFYILDYKSNYLGGRYEDYAPDKLQKEILASDYDVQYHIYTVALHRYLQQMIGEYDYEQHFGGVIYLFLRGLGGVDPNNGVYRHRPDTHIIEMLNRFFKGGQL